MATTAAPFPTPDERRPNVASADVHFPAIKTFEQIDREIIATMRPTLGWFVLLAMAILAMLIGAATWTYQIYEGLGAAGVVLRVLCWGKDATVKSGGNSQSRPEKCHP